MKENNDPHPINIILRVLIVAGAPFLLAFYITGRFEAETFSFWFLFIFIIITMISYGMNNSMSLLLSIGLLIGTLGAERYERQQNIYSTVIGLDKLIGAIVLSVILLILINSLFESKKRQ